MYEGYLVLGGNEVVNHARLQAYVENGYAPLGLNVNVCDECDDLPAMLGDKPYQSPLIDQAPWFESGNPDTWDFAGVQVLEMTGVSGSTRTASVGDLVGDGAVVRGLRYGGRTIACTALMIGKTGCAVEAGMSWLSQVLGGSNCTGPKPNTANACVGDELCLLTCCPAEGTDGSPIPDVRDTTEISTLRWSSTGGFYDGIQGEYEPSTLQAGTWTNLVPNPSFEESVNRWSTPMGAGRVDATNAATNPSLESNSLSGWISTSSSLYVLSLDSSNPIAGTRSAMTTRTATTPSITAGAIALQNPSGTNGHFPVTAGTPVTASMDVRPELAGRRIRCWFTWHDAANVQTTSTPVIAVTDSVAGTTYRVVATEVPPAGTVGARVRFSVELPTGNATTGERAWFDRANWGGETYFDGSTPPGGGFTYRWTGTPHDSTSERLAPGAGTGTLEHVTTDWPSRWGTASALYTVTGSALDQYIETEPIQVPSGAYVNARAAIGTIQNQVQARLSVRFYDGANAQIGSVYNSAWVPMNTSSYATVWGSVARPASAVTLRLRVEFQTPQSTALPIGAGVYTDAVMVSTDPTALKPMYFDGNGVDGPGSEFAWTGTPNDSTSTHVVTAQPSTLTGPVIECYDDAIFDFGIETISGMVTVTPQALDADGTTVLWTGGQVTVSGSSPAVLILPDVTWGEWRPRLLIEQGNPFTIEPRLNHPKFRTTEECADQLMRSYLDVTTIEGPTVVEKIGLACGEYIYKVEWTMMAANPMILGPTEAFAQSVWAATGSSLSPRAQEYVLAPKVLVGVVPDPVIDEQTDCDVDDTTPLSVFDPCCPGFLLPPSPPFIKDLCFDVPTSYDRTWVQIPKDYAPAIEDGLMSITITNDSHNKRGLRIRVYPDPIGTGYQQGVYDDDGNLKTPSVTTPEECDFCDEFFITYIPANAVWRLDGPNRRITTQPSGLSQQIISSASVRGRGGGPFTFPVMSCNMGYLIMVDVPTAYVENCGADCIGYTQGSCWVDITMRRATS